MAQMPPQGESIGLALEDVVLLARIMEKQQSNKPFEQIFTLYDSLRRERIESAFEEANFRWETVKDKGFVGGLMVEWLTMLVLWYGKEKRAQALMHDVRSINLAD
jgi:salicylate hydroxylase